MREKDKVGKEESIRLRMFVLEKERSKERKREREIE